jgi:hypothetical protein
MFSLCLSKPLAVIILCQVYNLILEQIQKLLKLCKEQRERERAEYDSRLELSKELFNESKHPFSAEVETKPKMFAKVAIKYDKVKRTRLGAISKLFIPIAKYQVKTTQIVAVIYKGQTDYAQQQEQSHKSRT